MATDARLPDAPIQRMGLGLAAVGRPGYITPGRTDDLPPERTAAAMRRHTHELLDLAYSRGIRYIDTARSYGRAEEFLADWMKNGGDLRDVFIASKWGYAYTADWHIHAQTHEVKDHSIRTYDRQLAETRSLLGGHLDLYQVHSVTPDSAALTDTALHHRLAALAAEGITVGLTTTGPNQSDAIRAALDITIDGEPLFHSVQATWNLLEPSAGPALAEAHDAGRMVIIKEALANGQLAQRHHQPHLRRVLAPIADDTGVSFDAIALAAALRQPWADIVLSGAATTCQLTSNLLATTVHLGTDEVAQLAGLAETPHTYWTHRSQLPWT
ncbi:aldo/keto reductase [Streptomyces sp. RB6PN25]|uniref:Aldo/keto reductase n=1 Tax=Streptomyces humicola TaxID=2953240 RepID=A0ABT1PVP3_9ACTN|nr:aldo/keto reductase [Streptomyces humicola]MCQ4081741.1 aldo/keto reductase [Streptomyces humicola]